MLSVTQSSSYLTIPDEYVHSGSISCPLSFLALLMSKVDTSRAIDICIEEVVCHYSSGVYSRMRTKLTKPGRDTLSFTCVRNRMPKGLVQACDPLPIGNARALQQMGLYRHLMIVDDWSTLFAVVNKLTKYWEVSQRLSEYGTLHRCLLRYTMGDRCNT